MSLSTRLLRNFASRISVVLLILVAGNVGLYAQSTANYTYVLSTAGSLSLDRNGNTINLATGATTLVAAGSNDVASAQVTLPFDFFLNGKRYNIYSATDNGIITLGTTTVATNNVYTLPNSTVATIAPFANDMVVGSNGVVRSEVFGVAPNRTFVVEWSNNIIRNTASAPTVGNSNWQVRMYEGSGIIEYVYGAMATNNATPTSYYIGFSTNTSTNNILTVSTATNTVSTTTTTNANTYFSNILLPLNSTADGSRAVYTFIPPGNTGNTVTTSLGAPTNLTFSAITANSYSLNWTVPSPTTGIVGYAIYSSTDNVNFNYLTTVTGAATGTFAATSMNAGAITYYKVYAYSEGTLSAPATGSQTTLAANVNTALLSGNWSSTSTWSTGVLPLATDSVVIPAGITVTIDGADVCNSIYIQGILQYDATGTVRTLTATKNVNVASGGIFQTQSTGTASEVLSLGGDFTNAGTVNFVTGTSKTAITFTGAQNNTFDISAGTATTNLFTVTVNKGSAVTNILDFLPGTLTVSGANVAGFLTITNGAFKLDGTNTFSNPLFAVAAYTISATGEFWLNNANATIVAQNASPGTMAGTLRISQGIFNVGTAAGQNFTTSGASVVDIIEGGTVNVAGFFNATTSGATFTMSGGTLNVATVGNTSTTASMACSVLFNVSGGVINIKTPSTGSTPLDYQVSSSFPSNINITGGTLNLGTVSGAKYRVSGALLPTVNYGATVTNVTMSGTTYAYGNLTIPAGDTLTTGAFTLNLLQNFVNNGVLLGGVSGSGLGFVGTAAQTLSGTGTIPLYIAALTVNNTSGASPAVTINEADTVLTSFNLTAGSLSGSLTLGGRSGTLTTTVVNGTLTTVPTFALTGGTYNVTYNYSFAPYNTGNELGYDSVNTLTINNLTGVTLNSPLYVKTNLTLTAGVLTTSTANQPTLGTTVGTPPTGSITAYVNGPLGINLNTATNTFKVFAIGKGSLYRPLTITNFESNGTLQTYTAEVFNANSGGTGASGITLDAARYYHLTNTANIFSTTTAGIVLTINTDGISYSSAAIAQSATVNGTYTSIGSRSNAIGGVQVDTSSLAVIQGDDYVLLSTNGTLCSAPAQPTALTFTNNTGTGVTVGYTPNASFPTGYIVVASTSPLSQEPANGTSYYAGGALGNGTIVGVGLPTIISGIAAYGFDTATSIPTTYILTPNTQYYITLFPYNKVSCGGPVYDTTAPLSSTLTTGCGIAFLSPTNITNTAFTMNWLPINNTSGSNYTVDVSLTNTFTTDISGYPVTAAASATSQTVTGLTTGTTYFYKITTTGACGTGVSTVYSIVMPVSTPVTLTPVSYNYDIIANGVNNLNSVNNTVTTSPVLPTNGFDHAGFNLVSADYPYLSGSTGLPLGGSVKETNGIQGVVYQLAPYFQNNALWFASGNTSLYAPTTATVSLVTPIAATTVYIAYVSGAGANTASYTVNFGDGSSQSFSGQAMNDWCSGTNAVTATISRVSASTLGTSANGQASNCPYIYRNTLALSPSNYAKLITGVTIQITGASNTFPAILGVSVQQPSTITASVASLSAFGTVANCAPSAPQTFTLSGAHLNPAVFAGTGNITVTVPTGFQVASGVNGTYGTTATIPYVNCAFTNDTVYVRVNAITPGTYTGNLTFSGGAIINPPVFALSATTAGINIAPTTATAFGNVSVNTSSNGATYSISGANLTPGTINVSSSNANFQVSSDNLNWVSSYGITVSGTTLASTFVYVRFSPTFTGVQLDTVNFSGAGLSTCSYITANGNGATSCVTPPSMAAITLSASSTTDSIRFTPPSPVPDGYLLVQSTAPFTGATTDGTEYTVSQTLGNGTIIQKNINSVPQPFVVTGLTANTVYYYTVIPYNGGTTGTCAGTPLYGTPVTNNNTTCAGTPGTPTISGLSSGSFTVNWTASTGGTANAITYLVDVSASSTFTSDISGYPIITSATTATVNGLTPGTLLYARVTAIGACNSATTPSVSATTGTSNYAVVPLTPGSYNNDVVAEGSANPTTTVTNPATNPNSNSASYYFGGGYGFVGNNYSFVSYPASNGTLPAGGTLNSILTPGLTYQMASYTGNNALTLFGYTTSTGTITFTNPMYASTLYLSGTASNGPAVISSITITFSDNSTQPGGTWSINDWFNGANPDIHGIGRIGIPGGAASGTIGSTGNPQLYQDAITILPANYGKTIKSVTFNTTGNTSVSTSQEAAIVAASVKDGYLYPSVTSLPAFACATSGAQSFTFNASSLSPAAGNITVTAPTGFLVSTDNINFGATANVAYTGSAVAGASVYVEFNVATLGSASGNVTFSGGTLNSPQSVAVSATGTGLYVSPATTMAFGNVITNTTSSSLIDTVKGSGLTAGNITVTSPDAHYLLSLDNVNFSASLVYPNGSTTDTPIYIQFTPTVSGPDSTLITLALSGGTLCTIPTIKATGTATNPCVNPTVLPTALTFPNTTASSTGITFTPNSTPDGYLVLQGSAAFAGTTTDNTNYTVGNTVGNAVVQAVLNNVPPITFPGTLTNQVGAPIVGNTTYHVTVIPFNGGANGTCGGGPLYDAGNLQGTYTTCPAAPAIVSTTAGVTNGSLRWASSSGGGVNTITYTVDVSTNNTFTADITGYPATVSDSVGGDITSAINNLSASTIYYYRIVANGGCTSTATTGQITTTNYCTPTYSTGCNDDDYIASFSLAGTTLLTGGSNGNCVGNYLFLNETVTVIAGVATPFSATFGEAQGYIAIFADLNHDGVFTDANDQIFSTLADVASTSGNITIPTSVPAGTYRLRLINSYFSSPTGPCLSGSYGDYADFTLVVENPILTATVSSLPQFTNPSGCAASASQTFNISGSGLIPAAGNITATASTGFLVSSDNTNFAATATFAYTSGALTNVPVYVEFDPAAPGNFSGNVTFTGGSVPVPPTVAVTGLGSGLFVSNSTYVFGNITVNNTSASMIDTIKGTGLTGTITVTSPNNKFLVSLDNTNFNTVETFTATSPVNKPIYIQYTPTVIGNDTSHITVTGGGGTCTTPVITASGVGTPGCNAPTALPTALTFPNTTSSGTGITFTPNGTPDGYLILQGTAPFSGTVTNNTNYAVGTTIGNAVVQAVVNNYPPATLPVSITSQVGAPINGNTTYNVTIIPFSGGANGSCGGGPLYATGNVQGTYTTCPAAPAIVSTTAAITQGTIRWASSSGGAAGAVTYTVDVSTNNTYTADLPGYPATVTDSVGGDITQTVSGLSASSTYYYRIVAVGTSCSSAGTTGTLITVAPCTPTFTNGGYGLDYLASVNFSGIVYTSTGNNGYIADTAVMGAGLATLDTIGTGGYVGCDVYIDYNGDGVFTSDELVYDNYSGPDNSPYYMSITVPVSTATGVYRMRIITPYAQVGATQGACGTFSYGTYNDFSVKVVNPSLVTSVSTLPVFTAATCGFASSAQQFTLTGSSLLPASGAVLITAPTGFQVSSNGISYAASIPWSYTNDTLPTHTFSVKFNGSAAGTDTGTITFTGASVLVSPAVHVTGVEDGLIVSSATENLGNATVGTFSAGVKDSLSGIGLTPGTVTIAPDNTDFQVSFDSVTWTASLTMNNGTAITDTPIFIRVKPSASGPDATTINLTMSNGDGCTPSITVNAAGTNGCSTPATPANLTNSGTSSTGTTVSVTPNGTPDGYMIIQGSAPFSGGNPANGTNYNIGDAVGNGTVVASGAAGPFAITGLTGNTTYYYTAIAYNGGVSGTCGGGPLYSVPLTSVAVTTCIATPGNPNTTNITSGGFTINWTDPASGGASIITYQIDVATDNAFANLVSGSPFIVSGTTTSLTLSNLVVNTPYYYRITSLTSPAIGTCVNAPTATIATSTTLYTYFPVPIATGFNVDAIANGVGAPTTTTTMANGSAGGGFDGTGPTFVAADYSYFALGTTNVPVPGHALPLSGYFTSILTPGLPFQLGNYSGNNALDFLDNNAGAAGTLTFTTPVFADSFYVLGTAANGGGSVTFVTTFTDNTTQSTSVTYPDWVGGTTPIGINGIGRVNVQSGVTSNPTTNWFQEPIAINAGNLTKQIKNIVVTQGSPGVNTNVFIALFAVSAQGGTLNASTASLSSFNGVCAPAQTFTISGTSLFPTGGSIVANAPVGIQVSADGTTWGATASFPYAVNTLGNTTVHVRPDPAHLGAVSGNITFIGGTANNPPVVAVSGTGSGVAITAAGTNNFGNVTQFTTSVNPQIDSLSGAGLTPNGPLTVTSSNTDFTVSTDSVTYGANATVTYTGTTITGRPIYIHFTPSTATAETSTISITGSGTACTPSFTVSGTGIPCVPGTWLGTTNTDWATASNWSCSTIPSITSAVTVSATAPHMPAISSGTYSAASFALAPGATLTLSTGTVLNVTGTVSDSGTVSGAGTMVLNGSSTQTYKGNGTLNNLTVSNATTITSGSTLNLTGVLTMTAGQFTTNSGLVLVSNASGTARIATITGGSVFGIVKVQQYIPGGRRAFRFLAHPFTASIGLSQIEANMDITGPGYPTSGFTWSGSASPSAFWYNTITGNGSTVDDSTGWVPFGNTNGAGNNAWNKFEGIRILSRGTPGQGLDGLPYTPNPVTLHLSGQVNQGTMTEQLLVGDSSGYNLLGNPYPSPTDIGTVIGNAAASMSGSGYWVWNPEAQLEGAYRVQLVTGGAYFLPANASFVVNAATTSNPLVFNETNKGTAPTSDSLFKLTNTNEGLTLNLYDSMMNSWDVVYMSFNSGASASLENYDAKHLHNSSLDFYSFSSNNQKLSIDARPYVSGQVVPLGIGTNVRQKYIIKTEGFNVPSGAEVYLHDKYLDQYQQLQEGSEYTFSITSDPLSQGDNRFELSMAGTVSTGINNVNGSNGLKVSMVPNPATEQVTITYEAPKSEHTTVRIMSMTGQSVVTMDLGDEQSGNVIIPLHSVAAGMYLVELTSGTQTVTQRLVKQ